MSDVLSYNAIKQNFSKTRQNVAAAVGYSAGLTAAGDLTAAFKDATTQVGFHCATNTDTWKNIPRMTGATAGFKVCDTSVYYRCGASCSWTVPAGVTCAEFQIWGPGGSTSSNCCCGGAPFGPTGAYAVVAIPVTAGQVYTICAGCAYCCYATQTTPGLIGGPSYVTGTGLSNFCAMSGISCVCNFRASFAAANYNGLCYPGGTGCQWPGSGTACGAESCAGWNFCLDNWTDSMRIPEATFSCSTKWYGTAAGSTVYGISGMYPAIVIGGMNLCLCGWTRAAPVYGFETVSQCTICFAGTTCSGCNYAPGIGGAPILCNPGSGGAGGPVYGGCNACGGDSGRMGMVCVCYK